MDSLSVPHVGFNRRQTILVDVCQGLVLTIEIDVDADDFKFPSRLGVPPIEVHQLWDSVSKARLAAQVPKVEEHPLSPQRIEVRRVINATSIDCMPSGRRLADVLPVVPPAIRLLRFTHQVIQSGLAQCQLKNPDIDLGIRGSNDDCGRRRHAEL